MRGGDGGEPVPGEGDVPLSLRKLPPPRSAPLRRLFTQLTAKEDTVSVFIPFTHSCPPAPAPPHFPALFFPPLPEGDPSPWQFKTIYNQVDGFKKTLL